MSKFVKPTNDADFHQDVLSANTPTVVKFTATWCGPCKNYAPIVDAVAEKQQDTIKFVEVDIDENPQIAQKYGVRSIPTTLIFANGELAGTHVGGMMESQLETFISDHIS